MERTGSRRGKGGRPSSAATQRLGREIVAAAETAFLDKGFGGASVEAIASAAGTSKQTVYARFGSKERLFLAVSDALLGARFAATLPGNLGVRDKLIVVADLILEAMLDPRMVRMHAIITAEAERFPELAQAVDDDDSFPGRALILDVLVDAISTGDMICDNPHRAMRLFQDMVLSAPLRSAALGLGKFDAADLKDWARAAVDILLDGLRSRTAG